MILFGCSGGSPEAENNDDSVDNNDKQQTEETTKITDFQDSPGKDPLYSERYPDSVRAHHVEGSFTSYIAEATIEEVIQYYIDQAELRSLEFFYEEVPEYLPHWITVSSDVSEHVTDGFSLTLGETEDCEGCVYWVLYAFEWAE